MDIVLILCQNNKDNKTLHELQVLGRNILINYDFLNIYNNIQIDVEKLLLIYNFCFSKNNKESNDICIIIKKLYNYAKCSNNVLVRYARLTQKIIQNTSKIFLDIFFDNDDEHKWNITDFADEIDNDRNLLNIINNDIFINWCESKPEKRYDKISKLIYPFKFENNQYIWTKLSEKIIVSVKYPIPILEHYYTLLWPTSWGGSLVSIMEKRISLIDILKTNINSEIKKWAKAKKTEMIKEIKKQYANEKMQFISTERFE